MKLPFFYTDNREIKNFVKVENEKSINYLIPHLEEALENYIFPVLGEHFYEEIVNKYFEEVENNLDNFLTETERKLIRLIQKTTVLFAYKMALPEMLINVSSMVLSFENENYKPIAKWQKQDLEKTYLTRANRSLDRLIRFLIKNAIALPSFKDSKFHPNLHEFFIQSAEEFSSIKYINNSYLIFRKLKPTMRYVQNDILQPLLGNELYDLVRYQFVNGMLDEYNIHLLPMLKQALVWLSFEQGISQIISEIGYEGFIKIPEEMGRENQIKNLVEMLDFEAQTKGQQMIFKIKNFLQKNVRDYPFFEYSEFYIKNSQTPFYPDNQDHVVGFF